MRKIRKGNDFPVTWLIERYGELEDLTQVTDLALMIYAGGVAKVIEPADYEIKNNNVLHINISSQNIEKLGIHNLRLSYNAPNVNFPNGIQECTVDINAFDIVATSAEADPIREVALTSDMAIIMRGTSFKFEDFTAEEIEALQQPALDAAAVANASAGIADTKAEYAQEWGDYAKQQGEAVDGRVTAVEQNQTATHTNTLTIEEVTAMAIVAMQNRIVALEKILSEGILDKIKIMNLDIIDNFNIWGKSNLILTGNSAPSVIPDFTGQTFIDTTNKVAYTATGNNSVLDWK